MSREAKAALRRTYQALRLGLAPEARARETAATVAVLQRLLTELGAQGAPGAPALGSYWANGPELDLGELHRWWWAQGGMLYLPRSLPGGLVSWHVVGGAAQLVRGRHGLLEPEADAPLGMPDSAALLVPGLAFTVDGGRLGQGGGYYDRYLPGHRGATIGIGFACQRAEDLPRAAHDQAVGLVALGGVLWERGRPRSSVG